MSNDTRTVPVEKWYMELEAIVDDGAALDGWLSLVRAQGWSPVGNPIVVRRPVIERNVEVAGVIGKVVKYPGLTLDAAIGVALRVPA